MPTTRSLGARQRHPPRDGGSRRQLLTAAAVAVMALGSAPAVRALAASFPANPANDAQALAKQPAFRKDILPIFARHCLRCHNAKKKKGGLDLSTPEGALAGGESGPALVPRRPAASKLYDMIHNGEMPRDRKSQVSAAERETIRLWIERLSAGETSRRAAAQLNQHEIIPILLRHCTTCHNHRRREGGLDLTTKATMLRGGKSGPALVPGNPDKSLILQRIVAQQMPPLGVFDTGVTRPPDPDVEKLKQWIAQGAPEREVQPDVAGAGPDPLVTDQDRQFWAFRPPRPVEVPGVQHQERVRNPIDAFILKKLETQGLTLSPEADRLTLIRRAYFDLTGLPPTPGEVRAFVSDQDPQAYEKLIDRLLASPRYGERWGRYWLDLAGYADTESRDVEREHTWLYRDYVIRAFNADKPYDRFLLEQIAGDELADSEHAKVMTQERVDHLVATGFLRLTPDPTSQGESGLLQDRINVITDEIQVFSSGVLGLTIQCAQCHDHKLEPIPQRDYYRLRAIFKGALDEYDWMVPTNGVIGKPARLLPYVSPLDRAARAEQDQFRSTTNTKNWEQIHALQAALKKMEKPLEKEIIEKKLAKYPPGLRDELRLMLATPPAKRNARLKHLAEKYEFYVNIDPNDHDNLLKDTYPEYRKAAEETESKTLALRSRMRAWPSSIRALWDRGDPSPTYIYKRGDFQNAGRLVGPGVPSVLTDGKTSFVVTPPWPGAQKTGARLALARWLVRPDHPLTARVWLNRLWQHHFGSGIVATVENFGRSGARPTHPELLDWLALQLIERGWSTKAIHRMAMTSNTYRQSSRVTPEAAAHDPRNELLARMPLTRLDAEALRDAILFIAGRLDETYYGLPVLLFVRHDGMVMTPDPSAKERRSIYLQQRRATVHTMLDLFDYPQMGPNCSQRANTAVAPQALYLLNNTLIRTLADALAERVRMEAGDRLADQIDRLYGLALSRPPTAEEKGIILGELEKAYEAGSGRPDDRKRLLARLCHTIINSTAFIYVD
jgi:cytochrome c553